MNKAVLFFTGLLFFSGAQAQTFLGQSNEDFGIRWTLALDDKTYPFSKVDDEQLRIVYRCRLSLMEKTPDSEPTVYYIGGQRYVIESSGNPSGELKDRYYLQIGRNYTKFVSQCHFQSDSVFQAGGSFTVAQAFMNQRANALFAQDCFLIQQSHVTFMGRLGADDFLYEEDLPDIHWAIQDTISSVCGYTCRLAEGVFRGRIYQVWFTEEIPVSAGPWKLRGLPGAILLAEDKEKKVLFQAEQVCPGRSGIMKTESPFIRVKRTQYARLLEQKRADPGLFDATHSSRGVPPVLLENRTVRSIPRFTVLELE